MINQSLPHNVDIEKYILGCMIIDSKCADSCLKLKETDFYNRTCQDILKAIQGLYEAKETIDLLSVSDKAKDIPLEKIVACTEVGLTTNFEGHFKTLKLYAARREAINRAMEIESWAMNGDYDSVIDLKNDLLQRLDFEVNETKKSQFDMKAIVPDTFQHIENRKNNKNEEKLYTGFYDLDKITAGLHREEMTILAARPGVGKTAFLLQLLLQVSKRGNHCLLFSREMSRGQLGERLIANLSGVDSQRIRFAKNLTDSEWEMMGVASGELFELPIVINDEVVNVQEIRAYCREMKSKGQLDLIAVDYLQLCKTLKKTQTREREVAEMSWEFKMMAKEFKVPVIVLSQLSRENMKEGKEPQLHNLRDSGAIEQDADNVIFLHVPSGTDETQDIFDIAVIVAKQRQGPIGKVYLKYCRKNFRFWSIANRG